MTLSILQSGRFWALVPPVLLGGLTLTVVGLVHVALTDPSFAVEDRFYARALTWDEHLAAERRSRALGWKVNLDTDAARGGTSLALSLVDRAGAPVRGARVEVAAFGIARSKHVVRATLAEGGNGEYRATLATDRSGQWEMAFDVVRSGDRFEATIRRDLPAPEPP